MGGHGLVAQLGEDGDRLVDTAAVLPAFAAAEAHLDRKALSAGTEHVSAPIFNAFAKVRLGDVAVVKATLDDLDSRAARSPPTLSTFSLVLNASARLNVLPSPSFLQASGAMLADATSDDIKRAAFWKTLDTIRAASILNAMARLDLWPRERGLRPWRDVLLRRFVAALEGVSTSVDGGSSVLNLHTLLSALDAVCILPGRRGALWRDCVELLLKRFAFGQKRVPSPSSLVARRF